jgi:transposase
MRCAGLGLRGGLGPDRNHGGADMVQAKTWVAFDVHSSGVVAAVLERESGELRVQRLPASSEAVTAFATELPGPVRATYEAGPTGFVLARRLEAAGIECVVCAPGLIPRGATDRVKTDRRDAERLVRLLVAGELHRVVVPSVEEEALRDLVGAREDLRGDLMRARHRLAKLLLGHEVRVDGPRANWTQAHLGWLAGVRLAQSAAACAGGLSRRGGRAHDPSRAARGRDRPGGARVAVGADRAAVDVSARDRHAHCGRAVR